MQRIIQIGLMTVMLAACDNGANYAPVTDIAMTDPIAKMGVHKSAYKESLPESNTIISAWIWPAKGSVVDGFSSSSKGINIAGREGEAIYATAAGKVVYCGDGLRGYGNLIIIKHNRLYLSAYAYNRINLVKEGEQVKQGQKIAEMGDTRSDKVMLHFEIRREGKPIDPRMLLGT